MKLSRLLLISAVAISLTSCDDLFEPALENNQDISQMYKDPQLLVVFLTMHTWHCLMPILQLQTLLQMMLSPTITLITTRRWQLVLGMQT